MPQALHDAQCFERESDRVLPEILILALAIRMAATPLGVPGRGGRVSKSVFIGGAAANTYIRETGPARGRPPGPRPAAIGGHARPGDRVLFDATRGPARNPARRRCERCGKRAKFCKCGRERR